MSVGDTDTLTQLKSVEFARFDVQQVCSCINSDSIQPLVNLNWAVDGTLSDTFTHADM